MLRKTVCTFAVLTALLVPAVTAQALVTRVEIIERVPYAGGMSFGAVGPYEQIRGRLHYEVDPGNPVNSPIVDLKFAPRNAAGKVEFAGDFHLLKPLDLSRGNHRLLYDVNNRGNLVMLGYYNNSPAPTEPGNGFLMRQGYSLLWSAWNWDVVPGGGRMRIDLPIANDNGKIITGMINTETVTATTTGPEKCQPVAWGNSQGYQPMDPQDRNEAVLSVRDDPAGPKKAIQGNLWSFDFQTVADVTITRFCLNDGVGIQSGKIYELIYRAKDPRVVGLGLAAMRDAMSFFRFEAQDRSGTPNPLALGGRPDATRTYLFGFSQSGRAIANMLWQGLHVDEGDRMVAEGLIIVVASGSAKGGFNFRFAQTTHHPSHLEGRYFPVDFFPFNYVAVTNPVTGQTGSLLDRARTMGKLPHIIAYNHELEYWGRAASLVHTDVTGTRDVGFPENVRYYMVNGAQHAPPATRTRSLYAYSGNILDQRPVGRALLVALHDWLSRGIKPPESRYPQIKKGQLVAPAKHRAMLPAIPGLWNNPGDSEQAWHVDYGPRFFTEGIQDVVPPTHLGNYVNLVPAPDKDGTSAGGIRLPDIAVPLGTYLGWNPRNAAIGNPRYIARWDGSFFMFALSEAERRKAFDPRPSIAKRYKDQGRYVKAIEQTARKLEKEGLLLDEDVQAMIARAKQMVWPPVPVENYPFWQMRP
jgi:hypothetical protein